MKLPVLTLLSAGLLSKWGFSDGDTPEHPLDYWDEIGIDYFGIDWHRALSRLVREHLLPALSQHHQIELVEIDCNHNPIRASVIDGVNVEECWHTDCDKPELTPGYVDVPYSAIAEACGVSA